MSIESIPVTGVYNTRGGESVYGPGTDGNITITGTVSLNRDMYYNNLTVQSGAQLDTNGYRVFVKNTLHMSDPTATIGRLSNTTTTGTLKGGAIAGIKASDTLGGNGGLNPGENFFGEAEFYNFSQAIAGYKFNAVAGTLKFLMGGSGGASGSVGATGATGSFTSGSAGSPGGAGSIGTRPGFTTTVGVPGGQGNPGTSGSAGSPGIGGAGGAGGLGGSGGAGGGVVIISARYITGYGVIRADGLGGLAGSAGSPGSPGSNGTPGADGVAGSPAPDYFEAAYTYISQYAYNYYFAYANYEYNVSGTNYSYPATPTTGYNTAYVPASYDPPVYSYGGNRPTTPGNEARVNPFTPSSGGNQIRTSGGTRNPFARNPARTFGGNVNPTSELRVNPFTPSSGGNQIRLNPTTYGPVNPVNPYYAGYYKPAYTNYYAYPYVAYPLAAYPYSIYVPSFGMSNYEFSPQQNAFAPAQFWPGGAGGAAGIGGVGGIGSAGLPGSPGTSGYAGGGGVVLVITENDYSENIEIRSAAGIGGGGLATSGTVIIIKNESVIK
jgi:hypothetical protein